MPDVRIDGQWYSAEAAAPDPATAQPPPPLPAGSGDGWELPATSGALKAEIQRLQNSVHHLERSNAEMAEADPDDPDLREAIEENEAILVRQHEKISQCELRLQQLGGDGDAADAAAPEPAPPVLAAEPEPEPEPEPGLGAAALDLSNLQLRPAPKMVASSDGAPLDLQAIIQAASTPGAAAQAPVPPPQAESAGAASMTPRGDAGQAPAADAAEEDGLYL